MEAYRRNLFLLMLQQIVRIKLHEHNNLSVSCSHLESYVWCGILRIKNEGSTIEREKNCSSN